MHRVIPFVIVFAILALVFGLLERLAPAEGLDKNFAGLFPLFDLAFGTFYMPKGQNARRFGVPGLAMPRGILGQLAYPLRRGPARAR